MADKEGRILARLPEELDPHLTRIEILGNRQVIVENHTGVIAYDAHEMRIGCDRTSLCITGDELELYGLTLKELTVRGHIFSVSFED